MYKCLRNFDDGSRETPYRIGDIYEGKGELLEKCIARGWLEKLEDCAPKIEEMAAPKEEAKPKRKRKSKKLEE